MCADDPEQAAVAKGLQWLAAKQSADGSWSDTRYPHNTAITAYALRAFLANGHRPDKGEYAKVVAKGRQFLLDSADPKGYLVGPRGGNMYCHALATQVLAELLAQSKDRTKDENVLPTLEKAVRLILRSQSPKGGWRYDPGSFSEDISVTTFQVLALKAVKDAGITVPDETIKKALAYVKSCADERSGGFCYQPRGVPGFARTASGLRALQACREFKAGDQQKALDYLQKNFDSRQHYFYGHLYGVHVMREVGGKPWEEWRDRIGKALLPEQTKEGSWSGGKLDGGFSPGPVYNTAAAILILSVPKK
jgi:hypothetical protein